MASSSAEGSDQRNEETARDPRRKQSWWPLPQMAWFIVVSGLAGALVNGIYTFFPSVMTTMEKRFNITNIQFSYILMANDISAILFSPFSTYYMAKKHIPKHISLSKDE